jgi:hypothetical protein
VGPEIVINHIAQDRAGAQGLHRDDCYPDPLSLSAAATAISSQACARSSMVKSEVDAYQHFSRALVGRGGSVSFLASGRAGSLGGLERSPSRPASVRTYMPGLNPDSKSIGLVRRRLRVRIPSGVPSNCSNRSRGRGHASDPVS